MINITVLLFPAVILFSPLALSSFDNLRSSTKIYNAVSTEIAHLLTIAAKQQQNTLINYNSFPEFDIEFTGSYYNKESAVYEISFTLESQGMLNYNAYIINNNDMEMDNDFGYINNNKKNVKLKMNSVQPGTYQLIIELTDNRKETKTRTRTINIL
ncbi:hypothetical protein [Yersinia vastinensis]|uniref:hypothetical protein n=1 Tax=Yersinia vastinensis TaxID=2890318 RepID=UPI0011A37C9D|nr:hypothetical protein [Yersinia vastinensis]